MSLCILSFKFIHFSLDEFDRLTRKVRPTFIFCDDDVLAWVAKITTDIGLNAKLFTVKGIASGYESIDSLMAVTGKESRFVYVKRINLKSLAFKFQSLEFTLGLLNQINYFFSVVRN